MNKLIVLVVLGLSGIAAAQPAPAAGSAEPAQPAADAPAPAAAPAAERAPNADELRKTCAAALNADPDFAKAVVETYSKKTVEQLDQQTIDAHKAAAANIAENERHVIYAYAAMWIIAALFLAFMAMRQQRLKAELAQLRRDLEAAAKETK